MFQNPLMLAGLGGAMIPLVLHLLAKSRYKTIEWGAMLFLQSTAARSRTSASLKQVMLLLVRMTIVALLAIAFARPILNRNAGGAAHSSVVIILDASMSMSSDEGGRNRFEIAREMALQVLAGLRRGDEAAILTPGLPSRAGSSQFNADLQELASRLIEMKPGDGSTSIARSLTASLELLEQSESPDRRIVLFTDRQASGWTGVDGEFLRQWNARLSRLSSRLRLTIVPVGSETAGNLSIDDVSIISGASIRGQPVTLQIKLANRGPAVSALPLVVWENGNVLHETVLNAPADSTFTYLCPLSFSDAAQHVVSVAIRSLSMSADDSREIAVDVREPMKTLIVTDASFSSHDAALTQAQVLQRALSPFSSSNRPGTDPTTVDVVPHGKFSAVDRSKYDAIILADVTRLDDEETRALEQFAYRGGGVWVMPGAGCDIENANAELHQSGQGILPAQIVALNHSPTALKLRPDELGASATDAGSVGQDAAMKIAVRQSFELSPVNHSNVVLTLESKSPFAVLSEFGLGKSMVQAVPLDLFSSDLPKSRAIVPLVQTLFRRLVDDNEHMNNLKLRDRLTVRINLPIDERSINLTAPDGRRLPHELARFADHVDVRVNELDQAGRYTLVYRARETTIRRQIVVNSGNEESDPASISNDQFQALATKLGADFQEASGPVVSGLINPPNRPRELWSLLLAGVLGLLCVELLLARLWSQEER